MAIRDNLKGGSSKKLYDALKYSGLVTEDMTYDEMLAALAKRFSGAKTICEYNYEIDGLTWSASSLTTGKSNGYRYIGKASTNGSVISNVIDNSEGYSYVRFCPIGMDGADRTFYVYNENGSVISSQFVQSLTAPIRLATNGAKKIKIGVGTGTSATNVYMYLANVVLCNS